MPEAGAPAYGQAVGWGPGAQRESLLPTAIRGAVSVVFGLCMALVIGCRPPDTESYRSLDSRLFSHVTVIGERGGGAGQFNKPRSVGVDGDDNIYVVDLTGRVQKFSPDGEYLLSWQMPETDKGKAKGMCTGLDGNIILIEPHYTRVNHFDREGNLVHQWGENGKAVGRLIFPRSVAVAPDGAMWISEYSFAERVQKFAPGGTNVLFSIGEPGAGPGQFNRGEGLGVDARGQLFVADSCNHRIQVFSPDGAFLRTYGRAGNQPGEMSYPYDIRIDAAGRQIVCEFGNSRLQVFDEEDRLIEVIGEAGSEPGQFSNPWSIALDSKGNVIVADSMNHRVQKLWRRKPAGLALEHGGSIKPLALARPDLRLGNRFLPRGETTPKLKAHGAPEPGRSAPSSGGADRSECLAGTSKHTVSILTYKSLRESLRAGTSRAPVQGREKRSAGVQLPLNFAVGRLSPDETSLALGRKIESEGKRGFRATSALRMCFETSVVRLGGRNVALRGEVDRS